MEICLVALYCVKKSVISNLDINIVMLFVSCAILIEASAVLFEYNAGAVVEVHAGRWV